MKFGFQRYMTRPYSDEFKISARNDPKRSKTRKNLPKIQKWRFFDAVFAEKSKIILSTILTIQKIHNNTQFSSKSEKPHFWPRNDTKTVNEYFFGKTAVYVSCPYSDELSCKKSRKSLEPLSRKTADQPTNQLPQWFYGTCSDKVAGPKCTILSLWIQKPEQTYIGGRSSCQVGMAWSYSKIHLSPQTTYASLLMCRT